MAALALCTSSAVAIKYRPYPGTVPWGSAADLPEWLDPEDHPVNYDVPNFGEDNEITYTKKNLAYAEEYHKHEMQASFDTPDGPPRNYFIPHFGEDTEIKYTKKNIADAEKALGHEYDTSPAPDAPPRDYFVPHFGEDTEIKYTKKNIADAEQKLGHEYDTSPAPDAPPRDYFVPHFGEDEDITFTKRNIANSEAKNGKWDVQRDGNGAWILPSVEENKFGNYKAENTWPSEKMPSLVQTDSEINTESDPICSSAGCTQYKHKKKALGYKINYPVPNFGRDNDINDNFASLKLAEGMIGHNFQIGTAASKEKWHNPAKDVDYNFNPALDGDVISTMKNLGDTEKVLNHHWVIDDVQLDSDIKLDAEAEAKANATSDPICSSAGCTQYQHKTKGLGYKINYFVPNFGRDHAINQNFDSLDLAEKMLGHKWNWSKDDPEDPVVYNPHKPADPDIVDSLKNLKDQEGIHGKWNLSPDDYFQVQTDQKVNVDTESDPICSSAGCTQYQHKTKGLGYKINYPVPNFGRDHLINQNFDSLDQAEKMLGHKWVWTKDEPEDPVVYNPHKPVDPDIIDSLTHMKAQEGIHGKWKLAPDDYFQVQTDEQSESDPICSSAGCTQYKHKKKPLGYKINYPVPNFGVDTDIIDNHASLELAESMKSHKLELGTEASKAKWHNPAKDVDYNFAPKLDGDIITTNKNLADTEKNLGHHWALAVQLDSDVKQKSDPICASSGCPKSEYTEAEEAKIVQYPDPYAQGLDSDILHTHTHEAAASSRLGHVWIP